MTAASELLACPFCGGRPSIGKWAGQSDPATAIECSSGFDDCPVNPSVACWTRDEAIAAWSQRDPALLAALKDAERLDWVSSGDDRHRAAIDAALASGRGGVDGRG